MAIWFSLRSGDDRYSPEKVGFTTFFFNLHEIITHIIRKSRPRKKSFFKMARKLSSMVLERLDSSTGFIAYEIQWSKI